jgi:putative hemolysin
MIKEMEIFIVLALILINGLFAMSEIAILTARKSRLKQQAKEGDQEARVALDLAKNPSKFLSTVQIGITFVGIFAGAFGGGTIARSLAAYLDTLPLLAPYSQGLGLLIVVLVITYLSLILGELVPKSLALTNPEDISKRVARPLTVLALIATPVVALLSSSTDTLLRLLRINTSTDPAVNDEDVKMLLREGARLGVFQMLEKDIVERTMRLADKQVNVLMIPRQDIIWLDATLPFEELKKIIATSPQAFYPVCQENLDQVTGVVRIEDIFTSYLTDHKFDLPAHLHPPLLVPENMDGLKVLELFKRSGIHMALVVDKHKHVRGLISLTDLLESIIGNIPSIAELGEKEIIRRKNGTFLVDGSVSISAFKDYFDLDRFPGEETGSFKTIGEFSKQQLGKTPVSGDSFTVSTYRFEVMDMDGIRVDKVLVSQAHES